MDQTNSTGGTTNKRMCPAGTHVDKQTKECVPCSRGYHISENYLLSCLKCKECNPEEHQRTKRACNATHNSECECVPGFFCSDDKCNHCDAVTVCPVGEGVKVPAIGTTDTVCAPCRPGTYSNTSDYFSPCKSHTRCEDFGRKLEVEGTGKSDSVCGDVFRCSWMLPAGLWSGLVLTALVLLVGVICWRARKCRTTRTGRSSVQAEPETVQSEQVTALTGHCHKSCGMEVCKLPMYTTDDSLDVVSSAPITPLTFTEPSHNTAPLGYRTSNCLRSQSEPQEDEWGGAY